MSDVQIELVLSHLAMGASYRSIARNLEVSEAEVGKAVASALARIRTRKPRTAPIDLPEVDFDVKKQDIARCLALGLGNGEIAAKTGYTEKSVKGHVYRIFRQLGVSNRVAAANVLSEMSERGLL